MNDTSFQSKVVGLPGSQAMQASLAIRHNAFLNFTFKLRHKLLVESVFFLSAFKFTVIVVQTKISKEAV